MAKLPAPIARALTEHRPKDLAGLLEKQLAGRDSRVEPEHMVDILAWALSGDDALALPGASMRVRSTQVPRKADLATGEAALEHLLGVVAASCREDEGLLRRTWELCGEWATHGYEDNHLRGQALARAWLGALGRLDRKQGQASLDALGTFVRNSRQAREGFLEHLLSDEGLDGLAGAGVALKPADVVIQEMFVIGADDLLEGRASAQELDARQRDIWERLEQHPAGLGKLLRLDLNAVTGFEALLKGAYDTPKRAAWVGQRVALAQHKHGKQALAQRLDYLLEEPLLAQAIAQTDTGEVVGFLEARPEFSPREGWGAVAESILRQGQALAEVAVLATGVNMDQRLAGLERAQGFIRDALAAVAQRCPLDRALGRMVERARQEWSQRVARGDRVNQLAQDLPTMDPGERAQATDWLGLCLDNAFLSELDALETLGGRDSPTIDAGRLLVRMSQAGSAAPRRASKPGRT